MATRKICKVARISTFQHVLELYIQALLDEGYSDIQVVPYSFIEYTVIGYKVIDINLVEQSDILPADMTLV